MEGMAMAQRRILRLDDGRIAVATEATFDSEQQLHDAVAAHPEVLPHEDMGLGPLAPLAVELGLGDGYLDLLAADPKGQLVIVEFKKGSENPDVRKVVAQVLDYGASLWRYGYDALEAACLQHPLHDSSSLVEIARQHFTSVGVDLDEEEFRTGMESCLDTGAFLFVYCGRDLDSRTRRIMTYLAEGPRMRFLAVEMEYYRDTEGSGAVLVPRIAFVPSWIAAPGPSDRGSKFNLADAPPAFHEMVVLMNDLARKLGLQVQKSRTGWRYLPPVLEEGVEYANSGVGVYGTSRGVEFNFSVFRDEDQVSRLQARLGELTNTHIPPGRTWLAIPCASFLERWPELRDEVIEPYFRARMEASQGANE